MPDTLRVISPDAHKSIIYQIFLRALTPEGTLKAATDLLPHIASLGVDIAYLCPVFCHDDDANPDFWSDRQKASGCNNPKNPYRMSDYYHVDPEYGTDDDLKTFVRRAHSLGLKVMLDLVYFHCGPKAVFIDEHPDFVKRDADGTPLNGYWHFPMLNFDCAELREYLFENMIGFVRDFGVDGYRCDVGDAVPLDFWEEARRRLDKINPNVIMLNEGGHPEALHNAFDINYCFQWGTDLRDVMNGKAPASTLADCWNKYHALLREGGLLIRNFDNHDLASDDYGARPDLALDRRIVDNALILNMSIDGVPMLYNGNEIGDSRRHSIFATAALNPGFTIDWAQAMNARGQDRLALTRKLAALRHGNLALTEGQTEMLTVSEPEKVFSFRRFCADEKDSIIVAANFSAEPIKCTLDAPIEFAAEDLLNRGGHISFENGRPVLELLPYGALIVRA